MTSKCKRFVLAMVFLLSAITLPVFAESSKYIVLDIDGETFIREYPTTLEEYKTLVDGLTEMYNKRSKDYTDLVNESNKHDDSLYAKIEVLEKENADLIANQKELELKFEKYKKDVNKEIKKNISFTPFAIVGPCLSKAGGIGMYADLGLQYRLFGNLHFGLSAGLSVYNTIDTIEGRFGLIIGYSIY